MKHLEFIKKHRPCSDGWTWAWARGTKSMQEVWNTCRRPDWMCWLLDRCEFDHLDLRLAACYIATETPLADGRVTGDLLTDPCSWQSVRASERFALGMVDARSLAYAWAVTWSPTLAAAVRTAAADAAWAAWAAGAAAPDAARATARATARASALAWQADAIRMHLPGLHISDDGVVSYDDRAWALYVHDENGPEDPE